MPTLALGCESYFLISKILTLPAIYYSESVYKLKFDCIAPACICFFRM